jgi:hypothetical protein
MKNKFLGAVLSAVVLLTIVVACQKEDGASPNGVVNPRANAQPTITYSPNPGIVGQLVTVSLEFGTCGSGQLQEEVPVGSGIWIQRVGNTNAGAGNPDITYTFTPTVAGTCAHKFRAIVSGGPNCTLFTGAQPGVCLDVIELCNIEVGDYTTYSQGFYMSAPPGQAFMNANWSDIGPTVAGGCGSNAFSYSTPEEINAIQPGNSQGFGFRNQLITLIINSRINDDFGCLRIDNGGAYDGMTVDQIIALANTIGTGPGCIAAPAGLGDLLEALNLNFHQGLVNNELLTCCE